MGFWSVVLASCGAGHEWRRDSLKQSKKFFFEKKNQKTFIRWALVYPERSAHVFESLLLLFFRKEGLPSLRDLA
jgi:hypothetical protein